jgi:hypothetical protein
VVRAILCSSLLPGSTHSGLSWAGPQTPYCCLHYSKQLPDLANWLLLQTYKVITIPSPDPLERPSLSTSGGHTSGRSSAVHSNNTNDSSGAPAQQPGQDSSVRKSLSDRAAAFATASATAARQPGNGGACGDASGQQQQQSDQELRAGSAPVGPVSAADKPASGRFTTASDGYRKRTMSVRIDPEAEIDEEQYMNGEHVCPRTPC